jgi:hypothetical protein
VLPQVVSRRAPLPSVLHWSIGLAGPILPVAHRLAPRRH